MSYAAVSAWATMKPKRASSPMVLAPADRVVKASPPGGLRPALTTLLFPGRLWCRR